MALDMTSEAFIDAIVAALERAAPEKFFGLSGSWWTMASVWLGLFVARKYSPGLKSSWFFPRPLSFITLSYVWLASFWFQL